MISPELRAEIRRYYYAEHWKIGTIARELNLHPDTVRNAIEIQRLGGGHPCQQTCQQTTLCRSHTAVLNQSSNELKP